jgi:clan AA aspartic protease
MVGTFSHPMEVGGLDGQSFEAVEALVDTGSSYTVIPASLLRGLGITPRERIEFELADGRVIERDIGEARVRVDGRNAITLVVFGDEGVSALLGAYTLEGVRLAVDPVRKRLVPTRALLMRAL